MTEETKQNGTEPSDGIEEGADEFKEEYDRICGTIESVLESMDLELATDKDGEPYSQKGTYMLEQPMVISVDRTRFCTVKISLYLYSKGNRDDGIDMDHLYDITSKKIYVSIQKEDDKFIRYKMKVPDVPSDIFPETFRAYIETSLGIIRYYMKLRKAYDLLFR